LVYVNYGIPDDYETLKKLGIDVRGKIVLARYGRSWRGTKAKVAAEQGALACIIYSDPRDDGYFNGTVYPQGPFRPPEGVQRGSVLDMPLFVGDPESRDGANVMRIPVLPVSYSDAQPLLAALQGPVAPVEWRGALGITYHIGPGPATVRISVKHDWSPKPMYNVIATMKGRDFPDEWVIYGNHHDAWVNGAADPISGASALLEAARALSEIRKSGWQPKRTIKFALWDGEEFGLIGSTEWVEKHRPELLEKAVVYFNTDMNARGRLNAGGSPSLEQFFSDVLRDVRQPGENVSVLEHRQAPFRLNPVGAGSDFVAFLHHSAIPSVNTSFSSPGLDGVYHSIYDNIDWYTRFGDPGFAHGVALAQVMVTAVMRMADAEVLPFTFGPVARAVEEWAKPVSDAGVKAAIGRLHRAAAVYDKAPSAAANRLLIRSERALLDEAGLPGRPWYKHQLMAPGRYTGYSAKVLPGVLDSTNPAAGTKALAAALNRYADIVEQAAAAR
jgi:N-acetylated-alpha-linked acidic dipeptidase